MSNKTLGLPDDLLGYLLDLSVQETSEQKALRQAMADHEWGRMQIAPEQGAFLQWLVRLTGAKRGLEIGVFTGYSSLCFAAAMPDDGVLVGLDRSKEWTDVAQQYWRQAGVEQKIELRLADALEGLDQLIAEEQRFDFAFLDADKERYDDYLDRLSVLVRPGGVLIADNVFWSGRVTEAQGDEATKGVQRFNRKIFGDSRWRACMIPVADGLVLATRERDS